MQTSSLLAQLLPAWRSNLHRVICGIPSLRNGCTKLHNNIYICKAK